MSEQLSTRIGLIADDDEYFRMALTAILRERLSFERVVETGSFDEAVERLEDEERLTLAVFDLSMPGLDGPAALRTIRESFPVERLAVVSASRDRNDILQSLEAGAHGFVSKAQGPNELLSALQQILAGTVYVSPVLAELTPGVRSAPGFAAAASHFSHNGPRLTPRQKDVLRMLVDGKSNKEIARALGLGPGTVKVHMAALFRTLAVTNRAAAAVAGAAIINRFSRGD